MIRRLPYKTKQFFFVLIKLSIVIGAFYFIYNKLTENPELNFTEFKQFLSENDAFSTKNIAFLLVLSVFNWFFEILKWQKLVSFIRKLSYYDAFKQSLSALTASLLTPNRIGDYGAKALYFKPEQRKRVVLLNFLGNMMQMSTTLILGIIGFYLFESKYEVEINYHKLAKLLIVFLMIIAIGIFGIRQNRFKIKGFSIDKITSFIKRVPATIHMSCLGISFIRYAIFSYQFYFLLLIFGINVSYFNAMIVITSMYLFASLIPSIFIFDVIIKGSVAIFLFSIVDVNELTILSIVTLMWILNFVIPSIIGSFYVLSFKYPKIDIDS